MLLLVGILVLGIFFLFYVFLQDYQTVDVYFKVTDVQGINLDKDALYFGNVVPGSSVTRDLIIKNEKCSKCLVNLKKKGLTSNWINVNPANTVLFIGESVNISVALTVPVGAIKEDYKNTIEVYFWKII